MYLLNGKKLKNGEPFVIGSGDDAILYPANWLSHASQAEIEALGIVIAADGDIPDSKFFLITENQDGTYSASPRSIEEIKSMLIKDISDSRYHLEISGIDLPNGTRIETDRDSQNLIAGALLKAQRNPAVVMDWKGRDGWTQIGKLEIETIADAVSDHVQACFSAERAKCELLDSINDIESLKSFNTNVTY